MKQQNLFFFHPLSGCELKSNHFSSTRHRLEKSLSISMVSLIEITLTVQTTHLFVLIFTQHKKKVTLPTENTTLSTSKWRSFYTLVLIHSKHLRVSRQNSQSTIIPIFFDFFAYVKFEVLKKLIFKLFTIFFGTKIFGCSTNNEKEKLKFSVKLGRSDSHKTSNWNTIAHQLKEKSWVIPFTQRASTYEEREKNKRYAVCSTHKMGKIHSHNRSRADRERVSRQNGTMLSVKRTATHTQRRRRLWPKIACVEI